MEHIIVDVREPSEFSRGHVDGAINIPPGEIMSGAKALEGIDKNTPLILYCISGARSNVATHILRQQGFTNITNGINKDQTQKLLGRV